MRLELFQISLQVGHLAFELLAMTCQHGQKFFQLRHGVARTVVRVNDVLGLSQRQAQALGAQSQLEPGAVAGAVDAVAPAGAGAHRLQQAHVFVKAHGAGGQVKLFGKVADGVSRGHGENESC